MTQAEGKQGWSPGWKEPEDHPEQDPHVEGPGQPPPEVPGRQLSLVFASKLRSKSKSAAAPRPPKAVMGLSCVTPEQAPGPQEVVGERVFKEVSEVKGANLTGVLTRTGERIQTGRGTARTDSRLPGRTEASRQTPLHPISLPAARTVGQFCCLSRSVWGTLLGKDPGH